MRSMFSAAGVALAVISLAPGGAAAFDGCCGGYGLGAGALYSALDYRVPYFAAHPPVYYSYPVPRTYGYSPFAYGPDVRTPDVVMDSQPLEIVNPYVPSSASGSPAQDEPSDKVTAASPAGPLTIVNPFATAGPVLQVSASR